RLDPGLRLRALHGRRALLHRGHGAREVLGNDQEAAEEVRRAVQGAEASLRHGRQGPDLLRALRSLREQGERGGLTALLSPLAGRGCRQAGEGRHLPRREKPLTRPFGQPSPHARGEESGVASCTSGDVSHAWLSPRGRAGATAWATRAGFRSAACRRTSTPTCTSTMPAT